MITTKTVLVLGAGASKPYKFPTGSDLVGQIRNFAGSSWRVDECRSFLEWVQLNAPDEETCWTSIVEDIESLCGELTQSRPDSIDQFLERRPDIANAGRLAISILLLRAEHRSEATLWTDATKGHWYNYLKSQLVNPPDELGRDQLRIITFNYDRSLEHYLYQSLKPYYSGNMTEEEYTATIKRLDFLHVYGSLGPLSWQSAVGTVSYGSFGNREILAASKSVKVLHEGPDDAVRQNFKTAKEWLKWAERILFLGFGFHKDNVERLALNEILREYMSKQVAATCLGLDLTSRDRVEWGLRARNGPPAITFPTPDADCYKFMHEHVVLS